MVKQLFVALFILTFSTTSNAAFDDQSKQSLTPEMQLIIKTAASNPDKSHLDIVQSTMIAAYPNLKGPIEAYINSLSAPASAKNQSQKPSPDAEQQKTPPTSDETNQKAKKPSLPLFDAKLWDLQVELGASASAGDSDQKTVALGIGGKRKFGERWEHVIDVDVDFAQSEGTSTKERYVAKHEMLWRPWDKFFVINFAQFEHDKFSGYDYQVTENLGLGYQVFDNKSLKLRLDAGPGVRYSNFAEAGLPSESEILARIASDVSWRISDNFQISDKLSFVFGDGFTTMDNKFELTSKFNSSLAARLSYQLKYDSAAPVGTKRWDSISRITLVYDF